jgi:Ni,Fe-hydrogenase III large subunit
MSRKVTYVSAQEIKKTIATGNTGRAANLAQPDFKLKKHTGAKSPFGIASACATGTVFDGLVTKD